jgi:hypothetical protein
VASLNADSRGVTYICNLFLVQVRCHISSYFMALVVHLLAAAVGHPVVLQLVLEDPDDHRVGNGAADVGGGHCVQALVLGDVVLEEEGVGLRRML